eukprot:5310661-Pyramimonas_sp.AAC.1
MEYPLLLEGERLVFENAMAAHGYNRLRVLCHTHRGSCGKSRCTGVRQTQNLGFFEPVAFLAVWLIKGRDPVVRTKADHRQVREPTLEEMRQWLEDNPGGVHRA